MNFSYEIWRLYSGHMYHTMLSWTNLYKYCTPKNRRKHIHQLSKSDMSYCKRRANTQVKCHSRFTSGHEYFMLMHELSSSRMLSFSQYLLFHFGKIFYGNTQRRTLSTLTRRNTFFREIYNYSMKWTCIRITSMQTNQMSFTWGASSFSFIILCFRFCKINTDCNVWHPHWLIGFIIFVTGTWLAAVLLWLVQTFWLRKTNCIVLSPIKNVIWKHKRTHLVRDIHQQNNLLEMKS